MILKGRGQGLFSLGVAVAALILIILSFDFNEKSRLIPIFVGILLLGMSILQFIGDTFPKISKQLPFVHQKGILTASTEITANESGVRLEGHKAKEGEESWLQVYKIFGLSAVFIFLMFLTNKAFCMLLSTYLLLCILY